MSAQDSRDVAADTHMNLDPGTRLGHYDILGPLGAGGMGEVYRATDTRLGRDVALKVLPAALAQDPERLARFQREARTVATLNHPHIVTIHSVDEANGVQFLTMELIEGQSLDRAIPSCGLPVDQVLDIGRAIAEALATAHDKGIVHRDLKPANVMVTPEGRVKVLDFGLAKDLRPTDPADATLTSAKHTALGLVMGTPAYMSPEQVAGRVVDHRTDLFSLGILLYEMASGRRPFDPSTASGPPRASSEGEAASFVELASAILRDSPRELSEFRADLPADLVRTIRRCLEKDPHHRIQTARDVVNELRDVKPVSTPAAARPEPPGASAEVGSGAARQDEGFWVAVLPFRCRGANPDVEALAEGLSEEIVTGLSRFSYLRVVAHSSTSRYTHSAVDVRAVGREIGARYVMDGSLRQAGPQLRVAVQLVDANTGAHLWAETYDRAFDPNQIFALQDDLVPRIVSTVADTHGVLPRSMAAALRGRPPESLSPYEAVLRSFGYFERVSAEELAAARAGLESAVLKAPAYADAWAMLALLSVQEYGQGFNLHADPLSSGATAARRAVDAGPSNHLAYFSLAQALFFQKEPQAFRNAAARAAALNPIDGNSIAFLGELLTYSGDAERGLALATRAKQLNPHHPGWYWFADYYDAYSRRDYRAALGFALKVNMPDHWGANMATATACGQLGEREAAGKALRRLLHLRPDFAATVREDLSKWFDPAIQEEMIDGLRKAGLDEAREPRAVLTAPAIGTPATPSIAVLPFANLSADRDQAYFSDGLAEEVINALTRLPGLRVIARTSAFRFRGEQDLRKVGEALGVRTVLEGSVRKSGPRLRITAQLIDASDQSQIWSERFDRELVDVFQIQDEIAAAIVEKLHLSLGASRQVTRPMTNVAAYEALLEGRHYFSQFTPEGAVRALRCLQRALALEPDYPDALVLHALFHVMSAYMFADPREALPQARALAERALELDPQHGEAHAAAALVTIWRDRDWPAGDALFRRALALAPASARVHELYGLVGLLGTGRLTEALSELDRAVELDPLSALYAGNRGRVLTCARRFVEAEESCRRGLALDPGHLLVQVELIYALVFQHEFQEAVAVGRRAIETHGHTKAPVHALALSLALAGEREQARQLLDEAVDRDGGPYQSPLTRGLVHAAFSEMDVAFEYVQQAMDEREPLLMYLTVHPMFDALRPDPRYSELVRRMNL